MDGKGMANKTSPILIVAEGYHLTFFSMEPRQRLHVVQVPSVNDPGYERVMEEYLSLTLSEPYKSIYTRGQLLRRQSLTNMSTQEFALRMQELALVRAIAQATPTLKKEVARR